MSIGPGTRIGPFEVTSRIGRGGMGEVWRARDTRLGRDVAIKTLPDAFAADSERVARLEREARLLASLNHPNIGGIYGLEEADGARALVLELVEGETLADRLRRGPLVVDEALNVARQIAGALEAAHESGVIHRDLKPDNIKVAPGRIVKVLDFGLAKLLGSGGGHDRPDADEASVTVEPTREGLVMGTPAYMSPEQAKGQAVDRQTDIWAFGCVLFEMLTGGRAFPGDSTAEVLARVVGGEPSWDRLPGAPPMVHAFLRRCLEKDPAQRVRDIGDVRLALSGAFDTPAVPGPATRQVPRLSAAGLIVAGVVAGMLGAAIGWLSRGPAVDESREPTRRFPIVIPSSQSLPSVADRLVALSPDGQTLVYGALNESGVLRLYRRALDELAPEPVPGTEGTDGVPFFSPDGQWLGFRLGGTLMKVALSGGNPLRVAEVGTFRGASWGDDGMIVLGLGPGGLVRVPAEGGRPEPLARPEDGRQYWYPQVLPGDRGVVFTSATSLTDAGDDVALLDVASGGLRTLVTDAAAGWYIGTGHLVFVRERDLWAVPFDLDRLEVRGQAVAVEPGIRVDGIGTAQFAVSDNGMMAYLPGSAQTQTLAWVDRNGAEEQLVGLPRGLYYYPRISPDGERIVVQRIDQEADLWMWDLARATLTRLTFGEAQSRYPTWTPDGERVVYGEIVDTGASDLFSVRADGTGAPERLSRTAVDHDPQSVSVNGRVLVRQGAPAGGRETFDLYVTTLHSGADFVPVAATPFSESNGEFSPDGRWIAYQSNRSGRYEVYLRPADAGDERVWQVSSAGGEAPAWSRDADTLYYLAGQALMAVTVGRGPVPVQGQPQVVIDEMGVVPSVGRMFDVAPDGERFLIVSPAKPDSDPIATADLVVVERWFEHVERLAPTDD